MHFLLSASAVTMEIQNIDSAAGLLPALVILAQARLDKGDGHDDIIGPYPKYEPAEWEELVTLVAPETHSSDAQLGAAMLQLRSRIAVKNRWDSNEVLTMLLHYSDRVKLLMRMQHDVVTHYSERLRAVIDAGLMDRDMANKFAAAGWRGVGELLSKMSIIDVVLMALAMRLFPFFFLTRKELENRVRGALLQRAPLSTISVETLKATMPALMNTMLLDLDTTRQNKLLHSLQTSEPALGAAAGGTVFANSCPVLQRVKSTLR